MTRNPRLYVSRLSLLRMIGNSGDSSTSVGTKKRQTRSTRRVSFAKSGNTTTSRVRDHIAEAPVETPIVICQENVKTDVQIDVRDVRDDRDNVDDTDGGNLYVGLGILAMTVVFVSFVSMQMWNNHVYPTSSPMLTLSVSDIGTVVEWRELYQTSEGTQAHRDARNGMSSFPSLTPSPYRTGLMVLASRGESTPGASTLSKWFFVENNGQGCRFVTRLIHHLQHNQDSDISPRVIDDAIIRLQTVRATLTCS